MLSRGLSHGGSQVVWSCWSSWGVGGLGQHTTVAAKHAIFGALDVLGGDAYAAGWCSSASERGAGEGQGAAVAGEWAALALEAWRRELVFFVDGGELVVEGELDGLHAGVERWSAARRAYGAAAERHGAGLVGAAELDRARHESEWAGDTLEFETREVLAGGTDPGWPRPRPAVLRGPAAAFGVYAAADGELDARVVERVARLVRDTPIARWTAAVEALVVDSRDGVPGECGPAGAAVEPSRAWWLRRVAEVARGWRGHPLWGPAPYSYVRAPVGDVDWMRPPASMSGW